MRPTPQQQAIIDHPLEPVRVTAGAGTGKTTTMAWRLADKVRRGEVDPARALGITFTNKAAEELAEDVRVALGGTAATDGEVEVTTYHGFAFGIVREFGPLIGVPRNVRVVTPGYVRQLLRDAMGAEPRRHIDLTQAGRGVDRLLALSSALGDHLLVSDDLVGAGPSELSEARAEISLILTLFEERKREAGVVDYADLVRAAHSIVTRHAAVAERIRARYQLVLLDEYQDTNPGQREFLLALFGGGFPVTAVGDSDQTIYEWRGASPENFEAFPRHFRLEDGAEASSLDLATSWRSGSRLVAVANRVRAEISKPGPLPKLLSHPDAAPGLVRSHWLHSAVAEAAWLADEVVRLHDEEGHAWREMALLFRKHRQMATIRDALVRAGVPVEVASMGGLLDVPEVAELHAWLRILGRPDDAPALARILLGSRYRLGLGDLAPLARWVEVAHRGAADEASIGWALLEAVDSLEGVEGLTRQATSRVASFRAAYRELLGVAQGVSLVELCRRILDRTGTWPEIEALHGAARLSARLNTHRFLDLAEDWSPLEGSASLEAFLDHLDVLQEDSATAELDTARVSGEDAVAMLTVHRAKGLEWPVVFLPALGKGTFPARVVRYEDPLAHSDVLPFELRLDHQSLPELTDDHDERRAALRRLHDDGEWRTAYVAVTRAASMLIATGAWWYTEAKPRSRSPLFELIDAHADAAPHRSVEPGEPPETLRLRTDRTPAPDPHFEHGHVVALRTALADPAWTRRTAVESGIAAQYDAAVDQLGMKLEGLPEPEERTEPSERFRTSVTGLVTYAGCPQRFRWEHVERLPRRPSAAARRGVEFHRRVEMHHRGTATLEEAAPGFTADADAHRPVTSSFDRFLNSRFAASRPILIEAPFELQVGMTSISGRIDAVYEHEPGTWEIVDFKSGRPGHDPSRLVQLEAYALAAEEITLEGRPRPDTVTVTFAYFGGDESAEESAGVDEAWLARAREHVTALAAGAEHGPFEPTPGMPCRSCDFVRFCDPGSSWLEETE